MRRPSYAAKLALARQLRRDPTPAERHAWTLLRNRGILGLKFRRQHVVRGFIVDFYCPALRLVLELDGAPRMTILSRRATTLHAASISSAAATVCCASGIAS